MNRHQKMAISSYRNGFMDAMQEFSRWLQSTTGRVTRKMILARLRYYARLGEPFVLPSFLVEYLQETQS